MIRRLSLPIFSVISALIFMAVSSIASAAIYNVGPGQDHEELDSVPWRSLAAGDQVVIHWRSEPYRSKIGLRGQGTASQPIVIRGVSGPGGAKPEITGDNAQTPSDLVGFFNTQWDELLGTIIIKRASSDPWGYKPKHITIENLRISGGHPDYQYRSQDGSTRNYGRGAAGIWAILVEDLIVKDCEIIDNANGLFVLSKNNDEADTSRNVLVQGNLFRENGLSGSYLEHNLYLQVAGVTYEHNRIERLRNGALGASLKDRSSGAVIRYNWIEASTRALDLVGPEDSYEILMNEPDYEDAYVYGNYFHYDADRVSAENNGIITAHFIHWGGDSGNTARYRMGTLYFFHNTFVVKSMKTTRWHMSIFDLSTSDQSVQIANNILHLEGDTEFYLLRQAGGVAEFVGRNWITNSWLTRSGEVVNVTGELIEGTDPGLVDFANGDIRITESSPAVDTGINVSGLPSVDRQTDGYGSQDDRSVSGSAMDLGAYEFSSGIVVAPPNPPSNIRVVPGS